MICYEYKKNYNIDENAFTYYPDIEIQIPTNKVKKIKKTDSVKKLLNSPGTKFSPSGIEEYLKCPLKFYYHRILKLDEKHKIISETDPKHTGFIVHGFLEEFYREFQINNINPFNEEHLKGILEKQFNKVKIDYLTGIGRIRFYVVLKKLMNFLYYDIERIKTDRISINELERIYQVDFNPYFDRSEKFKLNCRIDRIESNSSGITIVDYKTGSEFSVKMKKDKHEILPELFQLSSDHHNEELSKILNFYPGFQLLCYMLIYKNCMFS